MLGVQGNASGPKVYRCVACSSTFTGLASLLVHQATHASSLPKVASSSPTETNISPSDTQSECLDSLGEEPSPPAIKQESPSPSFYICECGDEFHDFDVLEEHKRSHCPQAQLEQLLNDIIPCETGCDQDNPSQQVPLSSETQADLALSYHSPTESPVSEVHTLNAHQKDVTLEDSVAMETTPEGQSTPPQDNTEKQLEDISTTADPKADAAESGHLQQKEPVRSIKKGENLPQTKNILKILASAYVNHLPHLLPENQNDALVVSKEEEDPVDVTPAGTTEVPQVNDVSATQMKRLLTKPSVQTKAPPITKILELSRKNIVSLTKTFSPVVVLETRQKLMDSFAKGTYGRFQCGRCRRVFQDLDKLTEHHFLHKRERIKCCRRCKQLIIGRLPLPDNHVCPQLGTKTAQASGPLKNKFAFASKMVPLHGAGGKKVFFCTLCRRSYARRWNLKTHRCHGQMSLSCRQFNPSVQKMFSLSSKARSVASVDENGCDNSKNSALSTDGPGHVKVETRSLNSNYSAVSQLGWTPQAKKFSPFSIKSSIMKQYQDSSQQTGQGGEMKICNAEQLDKQAGEGQWTIPLDEEMQEFNVEEQAGGNDERKYPGVMGLTSHGLRYFIKDGVRRYPCTKCQKTYSRASTLRRHLRLCGFRPHGFGSISQGDSKGSAKLNASSGKQMFPCFVCGKSFNRKDNMMVHRKKCQLQRSVGDVQRVVVQKSVPGNTPRDSQTKEDATNWGIMSLPSVLPRRVTCECGAGFTSPKLFLEHMQMHARESYTCPTCGETVNSWADYEVHLQIHMHPHHQLLQGLQPQFSQPLLLQLQQQQSTQNMHQPPQKQAHPDPIVLPTKKRLICTRCGNTFATRCSLRRHIAWNRCKGVRPANIVSNPPKSFHCSHCNSDFPNSISLIFHQRSGGCKPAIWPVRCRVCLRWFGTVDSLQKHLLTHKQSESYRCDVCHGTYPNIKSLKNHRRRIHRILVGNTQPKKEEPIGF